MDQPRAHRVVVVGGGFGGLQATLALRRAPVEVTLVDRRNFHLFQPLTYQVATGALSPGEIAYPLRAILKRHRRARVLLAEVSDIDVDRRELQLRSVDGLPAPPSLGYDTLIVSGGSQYSYFGHDERSEHAAEGKSLESALTVRGRIPGAFEAAEMERDPARRAPWLTFVVVGAGPTGVEMAGQIAELARDTLRRDFRSIDPRNGRILLVEAADRVLTSFPESLSRRPATSLERPGDRLRGRSTPSFRYRDKGNLATIGRASAVADLRGLKLSGLLAWLIWLVVHLWYLVGFQNRVLVFIRWSFSYFNHGRGARLITGEPGGE